MQFLGNGQPGPGQQPQGQHICIVNGITMTGPVQVHVSVLAENDEGYIFGYLVCDRCKAILGMANGMKNLPVSEEQNVLEFPNQE